MINMPGLEGLTLVGRYSFATLEHDERSIREMGFFLKYPNNKIGYFPDTNGRPSKILINSLPGAVKIFQERCEVLQLNSGELTIHSKPTDRNLADLLCAREEDLREGIKRDLLCAREEDLREGIKRS